MFKMGSIEMMRSRRLISIDELGQKKNDVRGRMREGGRMSEEWEEERTGEGESEQMSARRD